jgi:hypothetical protein
MKISKLCALAPLLALLVACANQAPKTVYVHEAPRHPAYLHVLSDLREAQWLISHRAGDARVYANEDMALGEIQASLREIRQAAIDDGKNIDDHPPVDAKLDRKGRLHRAVELLHKARSDVAEEEDNRETRELQKRIVHHIDEATRATEHAIRDVENGI